MVKTRRVVVTGLGPVSGAAVGVEPTWRALVEGRSAIGPIKAFDASTFPCRIAAAVADFKIVNHVPKAYRKATKVMARDIELAVAAADQAARDAGLVTKGTNEAPDAPLSYDPARVGAQIGAGLIAAELTELTSALAEARDPQGNFDIHRWGREGMNHLTPLWLLKYLPNMLACHVTIIHDARGPSNTITCSEASSTLSIGESLRVIQRGHADACFCGGAESKLNPMAFLRQVLTGRLNHVDNDRPAQAVRPFCRTAAGTVLGEGGAIVVLESLDTFQARGGARAYAEVIGFGASQTVHREARNLKPDPQGRGLALAIRAALREAGITPADIDLIAPIALGVPEWDACEAAALTAVFGPRLGQLPLAVSTPMLGAMGAGAGSVGLCLAAKALHTQTVPALLNTTQPLPGLAAGQRPAQPAAIRHALTYASSLGGQNAAVVLRAMG